MSQRRRRVTRWARRQATRPPAREPAPQEDERLPRRRRRWAVALLVVAVAVPVAAVLLWLLAFRSDGPSGPPRAAIVDQLSLTFPNEQFVENATNLLEGAGYLVDYYQGEEVTVDFFRHLPEEDYDLLVLRLHSARIEGEYRGEQLDEAVLFTNEPYRDAHPEDPRTYFDEQVNARLNVAYTHEGAPRYFGITADFIEFAMQGKLDDTLVIMMGCEGLASERTGEAFVNKGADSYVSWSDTVSASHTDAATERLLELVVNEGMSTLDAVAQVMQEIGPDPAYESVLRAYPGEG